MIRNERGFTLIEIIAVLVILGILAAVAVPRYIDLAEESKRSAAQAQVAELKSTLNLAYARLFIRTGIAPTTGGAVLTEAGFTSGTAANVGTIPDIWNVTLTSAAGTAVTIAINNRNGDNAYSTVAPHGVWNIPTGP